MSQKFSCNFVVGHLITLKVNYTESELIIVHNNVHGQIAEHIFAPNEGYCLFIINVVHNGAVCFGVSGFICSCTGSCRSCGLSVATIRR